MSSIWRAKRDVRKGDELLERTTARWFHSLQLLLRWKHAPAPRRLAMAQVRRECEQGFHELGQAIADQKEMMWHTLTHLFDLLRRYDTSPHATHHERAQLLGISHGALDRFIESNPDCRGLVQCAFMRAEVWDECVHKGPKVVAEMPCRRAPLFHAVRESGLGMHNKNSLAGA